jgi:serine/threonine protein kinase
MSTRLGKYHLIKQIGQGGMAEVFLAKQRGPAGFEQEVVVKRILPDRAKDPRFVEMFLSEARVAAAMSHPNIVQIVELGEHDGTYFIAMEAVRGISVSQLNERVASFGLRVPEPFAARIVCDACAGLGYAHNYFSGPQQRGVLHGDVSPDNILVSYNGAVKVIDFGLAGTADDADVRDKKVVLGKMRYMAPERTEGLPVDARSDLFGLSIVLYETLTGAHPFGSETGLAAATANARNDLRPPRELVAELSPSLERILELGLKRDRDERYGSADLMRRDLEAYLRSTATHVGDVELGEFVSSVVRGGDDDLAWLRSWGATQPTTESGLVRDAGKLGGVGVASGHLAPRTDLRPRSVSNRRPGSGSINSKRAKWFVLLGLMVAIVTWVLASTLIGEPSKSPGERTSIQQPSKADAPGDEVRLVPTSAAPRFTAKGTSSKSGAVIPDRLEATTASSTSTEPLEAPIAKASSELASPAAPGSGRPPPARLERQVVPTREHDDAGVQGREVRRGRLQVTSNLAGARVLVDGRDVGPAPVAIDALEGEHHITVSMAGLTRERTLSVVQGEVMVFLAEFPLGELAIREVPVGVVCLLDGTALAREAWSDKWLTLIGGRHVLVCDDPAGEVHSQTLDVIGKQRYIFTWPR